MTTTSSSPLPADYEERVYAGILGKLIGVYLGRPFEGWPYETIRDKWGEIRRYVHEDVGVPLIVADDDITGTFTFLRALRDHGNRADLTSREIGESWLNYIAEGKHILWWGGMAMSTEHTAYLRLAQGIAAPRSGSIELNGTAVAEEIGAQIFIDGWALVAPNQPDLAAKLATEASLVSHDGEAVYGAVVVAVMESLAFVERDIPTLIERALRYIPLGCRIAKVIADLREWHAAGHDWRRARALLAEHHGYEHFGTNCPMVSNHGVIILALLWGGGDFDRSMMIVNTCAYDTDCNAGNLGCLLGIRNGLDTLTAGYDWRTPVNDRLYLPAADGHWNVTDAATLAVEIANMGRVLAGEPERQPGNGARYHFELRGSTHGFAPSPLCPKESRVIATGAKDHRFVQVEALATGARADAEVATFVPTGEGAAGHGYALDGTPTLYPGQTVTAFVRADEANVEAVQARLFARTYGIDDKLALVEGPLQSLQPGTPFELQWKVPDLAGRPIATVGVQLIGPGGSKLGLQWLTWDGAPEITFARPEKGPAKVWYKQFIASVSNLTTWGHVGIFNISQSRGRGLMHTGAANWTDYRVTSTITPAMAREFGLAARVAGLTRYYALLLRTGGVAQIVCCNHGETILAEAKYDWKLREPVELALKVKGHKLRGYVGGKLLLEAEDTAKTLTGGGAGFVIAEGRITAEELRIKPCGVKEE